jgi:hypothetical protein
MDIDLLARVARTRKKRALRKHPTDSINKKARAYPLSGLTYCAHCERMAQERNKPQLRSLLSGRLGTYYRHKPGGVCGCDRQSVRRDVYEADFLRLIKLLEVKPEAVDRMLLLANQFNPTLAEEKDLETQKSEAIAICNRRIQAAVDLYSEGRIGKKEYRRRIDQNEREIASWQARTNEHDKLGVELTMCLHAIETITRLWEVSTDEDKQEMARHLFEAVVYELDTQQIVDFRLKPWADQFLMLRAALYAEELHYEEDYNDNRLTPTGLEPVSTP